MTESFKKLTLTNFSLANFIVKSKTLAYETLKGFGQNSGMVSAGNMAFLAMFCLFPFIIFFISLSGMLGQTGKGLEAIAFVLDLLPSEVSQAIEKPIYGVVNNAGGQILTFSILFSKLLFWTRCYIFSKLFSPRNIKHFIYRSYKIFKGWFCPSISMEKFKFQNNNKFCFF